MNVRAFAALFACGLLLTVPQSRAAVPRDGSRVLTVTLARAETWAVRAIRGQGWNVPIEGSVLIRSARLQAW